VYFHDKTLETKFRTISNHLFNNNVKIIKCNSFLHDIEDSKEQDKLIEDYHLKTHNGITESYNHLSSKYYWPNMKVKINQIINKCEICLAAKYDRSPYRVPLSGPMLAKRPFDVIHIDVFSFDKNKFLTIIDLFSRYTQAYFIEDSTAITVINKLRHYFNHQGLPKKIVCDEGVEFKNNVFQEFCKLFKIDLHFTTTQNSNSNSPVERVHSTLLEKIKTVRLQDRNKTPKDLMTTAILVYNQSVHSSTGFTPFSLLYGPFENLNAHEIDLSVTIYESYNQKRKSELLPFCNELYNKQLNKETRVLEKMNENKEALLPANELYFRRQSIRKADPSFDKVRITHVDKNKFTGVRENTGRKANIHLSKIKRVRKDFQANNAS
jgi:transposase InsO family protein